jgi:hypothetical protein
MIQKTKGKQNKATSSSDNDSKDTQNDSDSTVSTDDDLQKIKKSSNSTAVINKRYQKQNKAPSPSDDDSQGNQKSSDQIVTTMRRILPTHASRSNIHSPKTRNEGFSRMIVNSCSAQSTFHAMFTSFQRHASFQNAVFMQAKDAVMSTKIQNIPEPPRRNHIIQRNMEVASWSKQVQVKTPSREYDDNVGEDSLSSQSTYSQDIDNEEYLQKLCPSVSYLATTSVSDILGVRELYALLFKAVCDFGVKRLNKKFLLTIDEKQTIVPTNIVELNASSVVNRYDDTEFYDWAQANMSHSIWHCDDILQSPYLENAIMKAIKKSPSHSNIASTLFSDQDQTTKYQIMGFVASHVKEKNYLTRFHPSAFVIYKTDTSFNNTVVVLTMTSRHHILSNMQDRLLQLVQIIQYVMKQVNFHLIISNEYVPNVTLNYDSRVSYESMGFDASSLTQDGSSIGAFEIKTDYPIPMVQYGDRYTWAKYGSMLYLQECVDNVSRVTTEATVMHLRAY